MALNAGNADCTTGLSKRIYDGWTTDPSCGFSSPLPPAAQLVVKTQCYRIALAVVAEIQANAAVSVTVSGSTGTGTVS